MSEFTGLTFSNEDIEAILAAALPHDTNIPPPPTDHGEDWRTLKELRREHVKTIIHGIMMTNYLKANAAPRGLIVKNEPFIFLHDLEFKKDWSLISWHCTRDWLILIIKTATRLSKEMGEEIQTIEIRLRSNQPLGDLKKRLEDLNKEMRDFEITLKESKLHKLRKDVDNFKHERIYPYTSKDYNKRGERYHTESENSDDSNLSDSSSSGSFSSKRGGRQFDQQQTQQTFWQPYPPFPLQPPPFGYMQPCGPWPFPPQPRFPVDPNWRNPFLGRGGTRPRGRWRQQRNQGQVRWMNPPAQIGQVGHNMELRSRSKGQQMDKGRDNQPGSSRA